MFQNRALWVSIFVIIAFLIQASSVLAEELTASKKADIITHLAITGVDDIGIQITDTFSRKIQQKAKSLRADIPDSFFDELYDELFVLIDEKISEPGGLSDNITATYNKYYTHAEIKSLIGFYNTDLGKKTLKIMPKIYQENFNYGRQWMKKMSPAIWEVAKRTLKEKGFELPQ
jgi:hypothetical protein